MNSSNTLMQQRLDRLLPIKAESPTPASTAHEDLSFWEKELLESRRQAAPLITPEIEHETKRTQSLVQIGPSSHRPVDLIPGTTPNQIVYISKGRRKRDVHQSELEEDNDDDDSDSEPISSSHQLVGRFCIFSQVVKFPYKYMQDPEGHVSSRFFSSDKVYQRGWDLYYLFGTESYISKPLILVPLAQVQSLITDIQNEFEVDVSVPEYPFQIAFYNDGTPSPAYAGRVNSKRDFGDVQSKISYTSDSYGKLPSDVTEAQIRDNNAWNEKLDRANYAEKKKKGGKRIGKNRHVAFGQGSLERAQRHLGLRRSLVTAEVIRPKESIVQQPAETNDASLDLNAPVPYAFEDDVVVISIDVESWEMDHSAITEIGLSVLDTADIKSIAPGPRGEEWIKKIRSRHFRIKGRESLRNMKFCDGNPDMFQFGASEYVTIEAAPAMIDSCFEPPYSAAYQCEGPPRTDENGNFVPFVPAPANKFVRPEDEVELSRTLLLVGHGVEGDIAYLSALGSTIFSGGPVKSAGEDSPGRRQRILSSIRGQFDTATLYQALKKDSQMTSLTKMCIELGIDPWFAHNAGNDARYTLEAFVKLVIQSRQGDEKQDVGTKAEAVATAQFIPSSLPDTKTKAAGETYAVADTNKINWSGPTTTQEREWRPIFDRAYQSGGQIVASGDEGDSDGDVDVSADEMPY